MGLLGTEVQLCPRSAPVAGVLTPVCCAEDEELRVQPRPPLGAAIRARRAELGSPGRAAAVPRAQSVDWAGKP